MVSEETKQKIENFIVEDGSTWAMKYVAEKRYGKGVIKELLDDKWLVEKRYGLYDYVTLKTINDDEKEIAKLVKHHLNKFCNIYSVELLDKLINEAESEIGIKLAFEQRMAVRRAVNNPFFIITGVPGAGKTTVLGVIKYVFKRLGISVDGTMNLAPTGKASKRMGESLGEKAYTVDKRLLDETYILKSVCIIDECSMLDLTNCRLILQRAKKCNHLILLGDIFQLSSVGYGSVLKDLLNAGVPSQLLNKCFRVDKNAVNIQHNVELIRHNSFDFTEGADFHIYKDLGDNINDTLLKVYDEKTKEYGRENVCILVPFRKAGVCNSDNLNSKVEKKLFNEADGFHLGSRVMQMVNKSYALNGEIGTVKEINSNGITIQYEDRDVSYSMDKAKSELTLAYSMSIHKSQGSEYACVIMATLKEHKKTCNRNLIYTGITRAKKEVHYFFDTECIKSAIRKEASDLRVTMLKESIEKETKTA